MKKTLLKAFGVLALAATMLMASCSTDASNISSQIDTVLTLSAPEVKVTAYPGMNYVSWKPVANANGYKVFVYEDDHFVTTVAKSYQALSYKDTDIKNGAKYTYIVEAESKTSTGRSVVTENATSKEVSVTGIVPDYNVLSLDLVKHEKGINKKGNEKFIIAADNIHVARDGFDKFSVSFPSKAYLNYDVAYTIGNEQAVWKFERALEDASGNAINIVDNATNDKIAYTKAFPITVSGEYTIAVKANAENKHFGTSDYVVSNEVINVEELIGDWPASPYFKAAYKDDGAKARLTFQAFQLKDGTFAPASYYKVYRSTAFKPYDYTLVEGEVKAYNDGQEGFFIDEAIADNTVDYIYTVVVTDGKKFAASVQTADLDAYALDDQNTTYVYSRTERNEDDNLFNDIVWEIETPSKDVVITGVYILERDADDKDDIAPADFDKTTNLKDKLIKKASYWNNTSTNEWGLGTDDTFYTLFDNNRPVGKKVYILVTTSQAGKNDAFWMWDRSGDITCEEIKPLEVNWNGLGLSASVYDNTQAFNTATPNVTENDVIINVTDGFTIGEDKAANYKYTLYRATTKFKKLNTRWNELYPDGYTGSEDSRGPLWFEDLVFSADNNWTSLGTVEMKRNNAYDTNTTWAEYKGVFIDTADLPDGKYVYKVVKSDPAETPGNYVAATAEVSIDTSDGIVYVPNLQLTGGYGWNGSTGATENINLEFTKANSAGVGDPIWVAGHETESQAGGYVAGYVSETIETGAVYTLYRATTTAGETNLVFEKVAEISNGQAQLAGPYTVYKWDSSITDFAVNSDTYTYTTSYKYTYSDTSRSTANSYKYIVVVSKPNCEDRMSNTVTVYGSN